MSFEKDNNEVLYELNTKLYGFNGIIGRRDYFLNCIIIVSINLFFTLPYTTWQYSHVQTYSDLFYLSKIFSQAPFLVKWWFISGVPLTFLLFISNLYRRLNDINGKTNNFLNVFIIFLFLINSLWFILPFKISCLFYCICFIVGIIIFIKRGKITNNYPYDFTKEFNWGAFWGTWIWGLLNKSYKTLWMLLLFFTPWNLYFAIYCGLKGNEWAFKNKKWNDISAFNKSQKKQSIIFAITVIFIIPILLAAVASNLRTQMPGKTTNNMSAIHFKQQKITQNKKNFYVHEVKKVQPEYIKNTENTKQAPYFDLYMKELQKEIKKNLTSPKSKANKRVVVLFSIMKDGTLLNIKIKNSSGIYDVDKIAVNAVKLAFPYKPLPSEYKGNRVDVEFTFDYKVLNGKNN